MMSDPFFAKNSLAQYVEVGPRPFQKSEVADMPDPMSDPQGYESWLADRKAHGGKILKTPMDTPSRSIKAPDKAPTMVGIGMSVVSVPTKDPRGRGVSYRPPSQGRNAWQQKGKR